MVIIIRKSQKNKEARTIDYNTTSYEKSQM